MNDFEIDTDDLHKRMTGAVNSLKLDFQALRTGRASSSMLDSITVEIYGSSCPLNQCSTINVPDARMVTVNVWDKGLVDKAEKAIRESGLGINPQLNGTIIMLPIPELNEERRTELKKLIKSVGEKCKVSIRNVRREANEDLKKLLKSKDIGEDEEKTYEKKVQTITDDHIKLVDEKVSLKEKEIMTI